MVKCPGQDSRYWKPEDIFAVECPACGRELEFFKDEPFRTCPQCGGEVRNPRIDLGCAKWCKYARECLGKLAPEANGEITLCERLIAEMRAVFGSDRKRISHALKVLGFAEDILKHEPGDPLTVRAAALLHDIGIHEAERKYNSVAGNYQEQEGPPIARRIMERLQINHEVIEHVCRIIASHHRAGDIDTPEFRIIWDADWIVNIPEEYNNSDKHETAALIERIFKTAYGKAAALKKYVKQ